MRRCITRFLMGTAIATLCLGTSTVQADEQLFGFVRGAETLPNMCSECYQFVTMRTGKAGGSFHGFDFDTEYEYGFTDRLQASASLVNHYITSQGANGDQDGLDDSNSFRFGGLGFSGKYRLLSPFIDPIGLVLRLEAGYLWNDEVGGLPQHERFVAPEVDIQKNFHEDMLVTNFNFGSEWAWGKQPAEQYPMSSHSKEALESPTVLPVSGFWVLRPA